MANGSLEAQDSNKGFDRLEAGLAVCIMRLDSFTFAFWI